MTVELNTGHTMPLLGLGVYDMHGSVAEAAIVCALETGYRLIDTAAMYKNETEVGNAVKTSGLKREDLFITTKVDNPDHGYDHTLRAFDESLAKLKMDYVDLYLMHWPLKGTRRDTYRAIEAIFASGRAKSIGVANHLEPFLDELDTYASITPAVNQVEFSPFLFLENLMKRCQAKGTVLQAYTPLVRGEKMNHPVLQSLANKYSKSTAQIILRWILQHGVSAIPKSATPARIKENFDVFDVEISAEDMLTINQLHEDYRIVPSPITML